MFILVPGYNTKKTKGIFVIICQVIYHLSSQPALTVEVLSGCRPLTFAVKNKTQNGRQ